jgi:hypothetical protein
MAYYPKKAVLSIEHSANEKNEEICHGSFINAFVSVS